MPRALQVEFLLAGITDSSGDPLSGGKVYTYEAGTTTPKPVFTDQGQVSNATNPVILNSYGRAAVWGVGAYKFVIKDSSDVTLLTVDSLQYIYPDSLALYCGTSTGSSDDWVLSPTPALTSYTDGLILSFISNFAAGGGGATLNVSNLGAKDFVMADGTTDIGAGDIEDDMLVNAQYIAGNDHFRLVNGVGVVAVSGGGTGAANAADALENLGVGVTDTPTFAGLFIGDAGRVGPSSSDGSDNKSAYFGHASSSRGSSVVSAGNEHGSLAGQLLLIAGNVTGGKVQLLTVGTQVLEFATNSVLRWVMTGADGHLEPDTTNVCNIGSSSKRVKNIYAAGDIVQTVGGVWAPTPTANNGATISSISTFESPSVALGPWIDFQIMMTFTLSGAGATVITIPGPRSGTAHNVNVNFHCSVDEGSTTLTSGGRWRFDGTNILVGKPSGATFAAGTITINIDGKYKA